MNDQLGEVEEVYINGAGIVATVAALVDHLEALEITNRAEFAAHLRRASTEVEPDLGKQLLAMAGIMQPHKRDRYQLIDGGLADKPSQHDD
jgi:hypothetical protein